MNPNLPTLEGEYQRLESLREPFLKKARRCAELTVPFLVPPANKTPGQDYDTPYQSLGAKGVNNLAAKLLLALLPPNTPFFKLVIDRFELKKLEQQEDLKTQLEAALSEIEQAVLVELETSATRVTAFEALCQLLVAGNVLIEVPDSGNLKLTRLDHYVVQRDPAGNVVRLIIHEKVHPSVLPDAAAALVAKDQTDTAERDGQKTISVYTCCERNSDSKKWDVWQEIGGQEVPDSRGDYKADSCPFVPLRLFKIDGEDYGRGYVEQYLGDLISYEALRKSVVEGSQAAAQVKILVNPNGLTDATELSESDNGAVLAGREEDVHAFQLDKFADFRTAAEESQRLKTDLSEAFMLTSSIQRDAERVTAEEIRALINELETSLGGIYSVLAQDFQLPLAVAFMARMAKKKRLPELPKNIVRPTVTTGIEALGRGNDLQKLNALLAGAQQTFGPEVVARFVNPSEWFTRAATALGLNVKGLVRSQEEVTQEAQQAQEQAAMAQLAGKLGPEAMRQMAVQQPTTPA